MIHTQSYWSSEATNENQIGHFLLFFLPPCTSSIACAEADGLPTVFFWSTAPNLLLLTSPRSDNILLWSSLSFDLCLCSLILILGTCIALLGTCTALSRALTGSKLTGAEYCRLCLEDFVLLAASTRQFKGFHWSTFPFHTPASFSLSLLGDWWGKDLVGEELYKDIELDQSHYKLHKKSLFGKMKYQSYGNADTKIQCLLYLVLMSNLVKGLRWAWALMANFCGKFFFLNRFPNYKTGSSNRSTLSSNRLGSPRSQSSLNWHFWSTDNQWW